MTLKIVVISKDFESHFKAILRIIWQDIFLLAAEMPKIHQFSQRFASYEPISRAPFPESDFTVI